jgi:putative ABC transport system permease protein
MNLASRDIRHNFGRFALTTLGIGTLLMIVMGMGGIYRGLIFEATMLVDTVGADLWVVQRATRGPFAEISRVPQTLVDRVAAVPGIEQAREFVYHTVQRERDGKPLRIAVLGLDWPTDKGTWLPLVAGRALAQNHYEMIVDRSLGLPLGERLRMGKDTYTVVGLTQGITDVSGNGFAFFTVRDALAIQFDRPGEAIRLERAARETRTGAVDIGKTQPTMLERAGGPAAGIPVLPSGEISAVIARVAPGADQSAVVRTLGGWADVTVYSREAQDGLLLMGVVEKSRRQLGLFRLLLTIVSGIIMALILYTLTLDKLHDIALLKLIGAPNRTILGLILQQALVMGGLGYAIAYLLGLRLFPYFPRRVVLTSDDLVQLALVVAGISVLASLLGIWKALRVQANVALMG